MQVKILYCFESFSISNLENFILITLEFACLFIIFFRYFREELGEESYEEAKESTMEQLREFNERLQRLTSGNVSLIDELGAMQLVNT